MTSMRKTISGLDTLNSFLESLPADKFVAGVREISPEQYEVQWEVRKKYTAQDGVEYPEEAWMTEDGGLLQIQDLTESHAKNIIRMILRNRRETEYKLTELTDRLIYELGADQLAEEKPVLH